MDEATRGDRTTLGQVEEVPRKWDSEPYRFDRPSSGHLSMRDIHGVISRRGDVQSTDPRAAQATNENPLRFRHMDPEARRQLYMDLWEDAKADKEILTMKQFLRLSKSLNNEQ